MKILKDEAVVFVYSFVYYISGLDRTPWWLFLFSQDNDFIAQCSFYLIDDRYHQAVSEGAADLRQICRCWTGLE